MKLKQVDLFTFLAERLFPGGPKVLESTLLTSAKTLKGCVVRKVLILAVGLLVASCAKRPQVAHNYLLNKQQQRISWKFNKPVDMLIHKSFYYIDPDDCEVGAEYIRLVHEAAAIWERRVNLKLFNINEDRNYSANVCREVKEGNIEPPPRDNVQEDAQNDGQSVIYWMKDWVQGRTMEQARTSTRWTGAEIIEADVSINNLHHTFYDSGCAENANLVDKFCGIDFKLDELGRKTTTSKASAHFVSLMIHELGHVLGQSHAEETDSVMQPVLRSSEIRDIISLIDIERILIEYNI